MKTSALHLGMCYSLGGSFRTEAESWNVFKLLAGP